MVLTVLDIRVRDVMCCRQGERAIIVKIQRAEMCFTEAHRVRQHGIEYRLQFAR